MNFMNNNTNPIIIGIDHGYGNIKTAHCCFKTGVAAYDTEPTFKSNLIVYEGRYYLIGEEHKEFISDKMTDNDYYILTLAAVAREMNIRKLTSARVHLAAGLPLTCRAEAEQKRRYRMKQIYTTTLRLNLTDEDDRRAYEHLQRMDKKQYRSYSKAIVTVINDHFERQARFESDPYLETREKEDAFLKRITEVIEQGLRFAPVGMPIFTQPTVPEVATTEDDENISTALDFADSF